jgi:prophage antirepressor-like protein
MNKVQTFNYDGYEIRLVIHKEEPWWILGDICLVLDLSNIHQVIERIEEEDLTYTEVMTCEKMRKLYFVNESGLYEVLLQADRDEAKRFKSWVVNEVLPSIDRQKELKKLENNKLNMLSPRSNNVVQTIVYNSCNVRIVIKDGELWFVARDFCKVLGYVGSVSQVLLKHCKEGITNRDTLLIDTTGGKQQMTIISELNLNRLIMRSKKQNAEKFQDWVCGEVKRWTAKTRPLYKV